MSQQEGGCERTLSLEANSLCAKRDLTYFTYTAQNNVLKLCPPRDKKQGLDLDLDLDVDVDLGT